MMLGFMVVAFTLGIQTAGDVHPIVEPTRAGERLSGDIDGNGIVDVRDVRQALEIVRGYREATPLELLADPNQDSRITIEDVAAMLQTIESR